MLDGCLHGPNCKSKARGNKCMTGSRIYNRHIISGACRICLLSPWGCSRPCFHHHER